MKRTNARGWRGRARAHEMAEVVEDPMGVLPGPASGEDAVGAHEGEAVACTGAALNNVDQQVAGVRPGGAERGPGLGAR